MLSCPHCGNDSLIFNDVIDIVKWSDDDAGVIYSSGIICARCSKTFTARIGFLADTDGVDYVDENGDEIEEE